VEDASIHLSMEPTTMTNSLPGGEQQQQTSAMVHAAGPGPKAALVLTQHTNSQFTLTVSQCSLQRDPERPSRPNASPGTQSMSHPESLLSLQHSNSRS
jgi:hypothetical protein